VTWNNSSPPRSAVCIAMGPTGSSRDRSSSRPAPGGTARAGVGSVHASGPAARGDRVTPHGQPPLSARPRRRPQPPMDTSTLTRASPGPRRERGVAPTGPPGGGGVPAGAAHPDGHLAFYRYPQQCVRTARQHPQPPHHPFKNKAATRRPSGVGRPAGAPSAGPARALRVPAAARSTRTATHTGGGVTAGH
jgi:hypothetical protein